MRQIYIQNIKNINREKKIATQTFVIVVCYHAKYCNFGVWKSFVIPFRKFIPCR